MFYAIIPANPAIFAVQPNSTELTQGEIGDLLQRLERHFFHPIALVSWDETGRFKAYGAGCEESQVTDEGLVWREFELPAEPDIPF